MLENRHLAYSLSLLPTLKRDHGTLRILTGALTKRPFKKRIRTFLFTVLGVEDAYFDAYSLIMKLNNHYYRTL